MPTATTTPEPSAFGAVIEGRMALLGLSRSDLLALLAEEGHTVSRQRLSKWILGQQRPGYPDLVALADALRIPRAERGGLLDLLADP